MYCNDHAEHCIHAELKEAYHGRPVKQGKGKYPQEHAEHLIRAELKEGQHGKPVKQDKGIYRQEHTEHQMELKEARTASLPWKVNLIMLLKFLVSQFAPNLFALCVRESQQACQPR
jgi:hypothetical protein